MRRLQVICDTDAVPSRPSPARRAGNSESLPASIRSLSLFCAVCSCTRRTATAVRLPSQRGCNARRGCVDRHAYVNSNSTAPCVLGSATGCCATELAPAVWASGSRLRCWGAYCAPWTRSAKAQGRFGSHWLQYRGGGLRCAPHSMPSATRHEPDHGMLARLEYCAHVTKGKRTRLSANTLSAAPLVTHSRRAFTRMNLSKGPGRALHTWLISLARPLRPQLSIQLSRMFCGHSLASRPCSERACGGADRGSSVQGGVRTCRACGPRRPRCSCTKTFCRRRRV